MNNIKHFYQSNNQFCFLTTKRHMKTFDSKNVPPVSRPRCISGCLPWWCCTLSLGRHICRNSRNSAHIFNNISNAMQWCLNPCTLCQSYSGTNVYQKVRELCKWRASNSQKYSLWLVKRLHFQVSAISTDSMSKKKFGFGAIRRIKFGEKT